MSNYLELVKSEIPEYETRLPGTKKKVKYRPFLVKEEKILLYAKQNLNKKEQLNAIENVIVSCSDVKDINNLPLVDVEHMFLELRKNSIGEDIILNFTCPETNENIKKNLNLADIKVKSHRSKKKIKLSGSKTIELSEYTFKDYKKTFESVKSKFDEIVYLLSKLETPNEVVDCKTLSHKQKNELIENLLPAEYKAIIKESNNVKRYEHILTYTTKDGKNRSLQIRGLFDFFCLPSAI